MQKKEELKEIIGQIQQTDGIVSLEIDISKTKYMINKTTHKNIEEVETYIYLGEVTVLHKQIQDNEINRRIKLC